MLNNSVLWKKMAANEPVSTVCIAFDTSEVTSAAKVRYSSLFGITNFVKNQAIQYDIYLYIINHRNDSKCVNI